MQLDYVKQHQTYKAEDAGKFKNIDRTAISRFFPTLSVLILILVTFFIASLFLPWIQTSFGPGQITALHPEDRVQQIVSTVNGRVSVWYVRDGSKVKKGDKIAEIIDVDPYLLERLNSEVSAMELRLNSAIEATRLAKSNFDRQQRLYSDGLTSKREFELAQINYQKSVADQQYYKAQLIKSQSSLSKQNSQTILADRDGTIVNTLSSSATKVVKVGDALATFIPDTDNIAVELYISGNDVPLVSMGRHVRLVFDGWPSIQFSGWPSVSIGTFGGIVKVVDYAASSNGMFRVLVEPDPAEQPWPSRNFLRMGAQARGYIQLNRVLLGYEMWRQLNGFPIAINNKNNSATLFHDKKDAGGIGYSPTKDGGKDEKQGKGE
ncbi:MAG: HlyD family efflux transporter periplasmic adaptor subunit [Neisseriales bacterium]|nr:MAG: HlyD family efflux transporter periplasmic adaptor subunit [Neisseriales bacterium]